MAAYTSTQSGNFSAAATWGGGGSPADGDTFTVSAAHTVTIDTGISIPANGYGDSNVFGILQSQVSANTTLRMNGRLFIRTNGTLHLRDGATLQFNGSAAEQHGLWQENESGASVIMEGSDGMPFTSLSSNTVEGSTSLTVANASAFAPGEWIAVYDNTTAANSTTSFFKEQLQDEGFWIHDISSNTIYIRIFGGPDHVTVSSTQGTKLTVSNAKVFRAGQDIIFGTANNRNIKNITNIDYVNNIITCNSSITGTTTGNTVYLTSTEKYHAGGTKVRKVATITTAASSNSATTITVASSNMFAAGDEIWIEHRSEADNTSDYLGSYDQAAGLANKYKHTVSSVSGNTITLSAALGYNVVQGALVTRMTRKILVETVATDGSDYAFYYSEYFDANFAKKLILKDVYFKNFGSSQSNLYTGVVLRGFYSTDSLPVTLSQTVPSRGREPWIEGIVYHQYPDNSHRNDWGGIWLYDARHTKVRCGVVMGGDEGYGIFYEPGQAVYNSIAVQPREWAFRIEGMHDYNELAYNYVSRCRFGFRYIGNYERGLGVHDMIIDGVTYGAMFYNSDNGPGTIFRSRFTGMRSGHWNEHAAVSLTYCWSKTLSGLPNAEAGTGTVQFGNFWQGEYSRGSAHAPLRSIEHNYEYDALTLYGFNYETRWDDTERAWRFFRRYDSSSRPTLMERVYIPANVTVRVSCKVKMAPNFSGNYPYLIASDMISGLNPNFIGNSGGVGSSMWTGRNYTSIYTTAANNDYEEKQITIAAVPYPRTYGIGVMSDNANAAEGFWIKDLKILIDQAYVNPFFDRVNDAGTLKSGTVTEVKTSFDEKRLRLGGRLK